MMEHLVFVNTYLVPVLTNERGGKGEISRMNMADNRNIENQLVYV